MKTLFSLLVLFPLVASAGEPNAGSVIPNAQTPLPVLQPAPRYVGSPVCFHDAYMEAGGTVISPGCNAAQRTLSLASSDSVVFRARCSEDAELCGNGVKLIITAIPLAQ